MMTKRNARYLLAVLLVAACSDPQAPEPVTIEVVTLPPTQALVGQQVSAVVRARRGQRSASGVTINWTVEAGGGTVSSPTTVTDTAGRAQITWTMGNTPGLNTLAAAHETAQTRFQVITEADAAANIVIVSGDAQSVVVGEEARDSLVVRVVDRFNNPKSAIPITFTPRDGSVTTTSAVTNASGVAVTRWRVSTRTGDQRLTARLDDTRSVEFRATATPGPAATGQITPPSGALTAGDSIHLQFALKDRYGNDVPASAATFTSSDTAIAVITANGAVRGITSGSVQVTGQSGTVNATVELTFQPFRYTRVSAGSNHTCALAAGGRLYCFGGGAQGPLGNGDQDDRLIPTEISGNRTFTRIAANVAFTCAVASDQRVYCWGRNNEAQLGNGTASLTPSLLPGPTIGSDSYREVSARATGTCGLTTDGRTLCWGGNSLTMEDRSNGLVFTQIAGSPAGGHACGLTAEGHAYCWGRNGSGQLGNDQIIDSAVPVRAFTPPLAAIAVGDEHTCAVSLDAALYCWGRADAGQLGYIPAGTTDEFETCSSGICRKSPTLAPDIEVINIVAFGSSNCAVGGDNESYCWGRDDGQLGNSVANTAGCSTECQRVPTRVESPFQFTALALGEKHACGLRSNGELMCWGANDLGQLGRNTRSAAGAVQVTPLQVFAPRR